MKTCRVCNQHKPVEEFNAGRNECRDCQKKLQRERYWSKKGKVANITEKRVLRVVLFFLFLNLTRSAVPKMGTEQYAKIVVTNAENSGDIGLERTSLLLQHMPEMYIWE